MIVSFALAFCVRIFFLAESWKYQMMFFKLIRCLKDAATSIVMWTNHARRLMTSIMLVLHVEIRSTVRLVRIDGKLEADLSR